MADELVTQVGATSLHQWDLIRMEKGRVPQGSVIGPILFIIYINDMDLGVDNEILKFADDRKLYGIVTNRDEALSLQKDLDVLTQWTSQWQMMPQFHTLPVLTIPLTLQLTQTLFLTLMLTLNPTFFQQPLIYFDVNEHWQLMKNTTLELEAI